MRQPDTVIQTHKKINVSKDFCNTIKLIVSRQIIIGNKTFYSCKNEHQESVDAQPEGRLCYTRL